MGLDSQWRQAFAGGDLTRGEDYFFEGAVMGLSQSPDGWQAKVMGSEAYTTFVPTDGSAGGMLCDCPRFADGHLCKHLAATCMAIEEDGDLIAGRQQAQATQSLDDLVASVAEQELRAFLAEALHHDELLATKFTQRFGIVDVARACRQMAAQVQEAVWDHADRGFIDWKGALGFERAYYHIVHTSIDPLVERGDLPSALALSIQALRCLERIEIDDSDGFFSGAIDDVENMWGSWLDAGGESFADLLFERISKYLSSAPHDDQELEIYSYGADMARSFQIKRFADLPAYSERFIALADEHLADVQAWYDRESAALERVRKKMGMPDAPVRGRPTGMTNKMWELNREANGHAFRLRGAEQELTCWTLIRLRAMSAGGADEHELLEAAGSLMTVEPICQFFVDRARNRGDDEAALQLLEGCKRAATRQGDGSYPLAVSRQLAELLAGRDTVALREELVYQLAHVGGYGLPASARNLWAQIRATYEGGDWVAQRERLLTGITNDHVREDCLAAEGLFDRLMDEVEQMGISHLGRHEDELAERYPARVLKLYLDDIEHNHLYPGSNRKGYQYFAQRLRHIKALPGGEPEVVRIIEQMRTKYPRRPALMDELSRV